MSVDLDVRSKDLVLKEPLVIKYYLLREYFDEMYDMVEQILGKTRLVIFPFAKIRIEKWHIYWI